MARISDPDKLKRSTGPSNDGTASNIDGNVYFDLSAKTIELIDDSFTGTGFPANELVDAGSPQTGTQGGVDLQTLYSFLKEQWKIEPDLIKYPFPMVAITSEQFEFIEGWRLTNPTVETVEDAGLNDSIPLIRNGGWSEIDSGATTPNRTYMGVVTLGNIEDNHRVYRQFNSELKGDFTYDGPVNEAVRILESGGGSPFNFTDAVDTFAVYIRSAPEVISTVNTGFTYGKSTKADIGVSALTNQVFRFPLSEAVDPDITLLDTSINTGGSGLPNVAPYNDMAIDYYGTAQSVAVGASSFSFGVIIDANDNDTDANPTKAQIYAFVQYMLRQSVDISGATGTDLGTYIGNTADVLLRFVGPDLKTIAQTSTGAPVGGTGVAIQDFNANDINDVQFVDNTGTERAFPFKSTITLQFNDNLINDANAEFFLFYNDLGSGNAFGTGSAILVTADSGGELPAGSVEGFVHQGAPGLAQGSATGTGASVASAGATVLTGVSGYAVSDLQNKVLRVTAPPALVGSYFIADNDATTITIAADDPFEEAASASVNYTIVGKSDGTLNFIYDYDGETEGGAKVAGTDADVVFVCVGLNKAQYVNTTITDGIDEVASKTLTITSALERNYSDPTN